ncbi:MAG: hypothetical protein WCV83_00125 [Candidatus Magasanikbacteria bacterium]|jgi:hypothetical protein
MRDKLKYNPDAEPQEGDGVLYSWGEGFPLEEEWSKDLACRNDQCEMYNKSLLRRFNKEAIGVKKAPISMQRQNKHYALCCECPKCFSKFWFHIDDQEAQTLKEVVDSGLWNHMVENYDK